MMHSQFKSGVAIKMVVLAAIATAVTATAATHINSIDYKIVGGQGEIKITGDAPLAYEKQDNSQDNQIVFEFKDTELQKPASRKLDASSFKGNVSLISPYQADGASKVVVQLRQPGTADVSQSGNSLTIRVADGSAPSTGQTTASEDPVPTVDGSSAADPVPTVDTAANTPAAAASSTGSPKASDNLEAFTQNDQTQKFNGRPVTLQVRDADLVDVLNLIGDASGFNMLISDEITGKISLSLVDIPWDQALSVILASKRLAAERRGSVLRIVPLASLTAEKQAEMLAKKATEQTAPRVTRVFSISFAKLADLANIFKGMTSATAGLPSGAAASADPNAGLSTIQIDERTNSLIVRDTAENVERMRKLIELLDRQTPQVLIEAKVVEATEGFGSSISGNIGLAGKNTTPQFLAAFNGNNPVDKLIGGVFPDGTSISTASAPGGQFGLSPDMSFIPGFDRLNALLNIGELENKLKVVSSPRTVVLDKESASIISGTPVKIQTNTFVAGVGTVPIESITQANLSLNVTPTVTNEGSVLLDVNIARDQPQDGAVANRSMKTKVLVESGNTLVIGGIYTSSDENTSTGFPILRKIPIIGAFFGSDIKKTSRTELFIFITPRILNEKESGISG